MHIHPCYAILIHTHMHTAYTFTYVCIHTHAYLCTYIHSHTHSHHLHSHRTYIYTYIFTHHTCIHKSHRFTHHTYIHTSHMHSHHTCIHTSHMHSHNTHISFVNQWVFGVITSKHMSVENGCVRMFLYIGIYIYVSIYVDICFIKYIILPTYKHPTSTSYNNLTYFHRTVTELMAGSLYNILHSQNPPPPLHRRLGYAWDACLGMAYLHRPKNTVLHRDLKALNLLVEHFELIFKTNIYYVFFFVFFFFIFTLDWW